MIMNKTSITQLLEKGNFGEYTLLEKVGDTSKSLVYIGKHLRLERIDVVKILKDPTDGDRIQQFLDEGKRLVEAGELDNLPHVYYAGEYQGFPYIVTSHIKSDEGNLEDVVKSNKSLPLKDCLDILIDSSRGLYNLHNMGIIHGDVKLKNLIRGESKNILLGERKKTYLIDLGGKLSVQSNYPGDVEALANCMLEVTNISDINTPQRIRDYLETVSRNSEKTNAQDFHYQILRFRKIISRREFIKKATIIGACTSPIMAGSVTLYNKLKYEKTIDYVIDEIKNTPTQDHGGLERLFKKLKFRICDQKIGWLSEEKINSKELPFATTKDGNYFKMDPGYWTDGFWSGILWEAYLTTKEEKFKILAEKKTLEIDSMKEDEDANNAVRYFYSHAKAYEITGKEVFKKRASKGLEILKNKFDERIGIFSINKEKLASEAGTMMDFVPFQLWGYKITGDKDYLSKTKEHVQNVCKYNIRDDGSVRRAAIVNSETKKVIGELNQSGITNESTVSRNQSQVIMGIVKYLEINPDDEIVNKYMERIIDYYTLSENLTEDFIPYFDFSAERNGKYPKDSSAASMFIYAIKNLKQYKKYYYPIKRSLCLNYLSSNLENYEGLIKNGCSNWKENNYTQSSLIWGDYFFIAS